jgi:flagella basal body P-ring formation protein FlgA
MAHLALTPAVPEMALPSMVTDTPDAASPEETPPASPRITDAYANPASGRFSVTLTTLPEGTAYTLHGQYVPLIAVVVPAQPIAAGTPLTSGLLTTAWQPAHIAQADWITDPAAAMGKTARFALPIGKPLRAPMLALPLVIARQAPVQLRYVRGSMQLRTEGIALEEGRVGASIRVRNLQSQKEIVGIVRDANTVEIDPDSPR